MDDGRQALRAKAHAEREAEDAKGPSKPLEQMSRNDLVREVGRLNRIINRFDMASVVNQALERRERLKDVPKLLHKEAFMLMKYVSEGGTKTLLIWNSRDGVTPFVFYADGMKFQHDVGADMGPYLDRPECDMQWETRTVRQMMEAWHRSLGRALIAGQVDQARHDRLKDDVEVAKSHHLHIGLRNLENGKFTDEF